MGNYTHLTVYTDGASRGNPGPAASGIHIVDDTTSETVVDLGFALGIATNNVAEYQAVLHAVAWLCAHNELLADDIHISFRCHCESWFIRTFRAQPFREFCEKQALDDIESNSTANAAPTRA